MINSVPQKYNKTDLGLVTKARMNKWLCRIQQWGDKVFIDCLPPNQIKFVTLECEANVMSIDKVINEFGATVPEFKYARSFSKGEWEEFTEAFFARQDLLRTEDD